MSDCTQDKEPPYAEPYVRWCERSENESRKKTTSFSSYSIGADGSVAQWRHCANSGEMTTSDNK